MYILSWPLSVGLVKSNRAILMPCAITINESIIEPVQIRAFKKFKCEYEKFIYRLNLLWYQWYQIRWTILLLIKSKVILYYFKKIQRQIFMQFCKIKYIW